VATRGGAVDAGARVCGMREGSGSSGVKIQLSVDRRLASDCL
jgi:hypothetical protein